MFGVTANETGEESNQLYSEMTEIQKELFSQLGIHFQVSTVIQYAITWHFVNVKLLLNIQYIVAAVIGFKACKILILGCP